MLTYFKRLYVGITATTILILQMRLELPVISSLRILDPDVSSPIALIAVQLLLAFGSFLLFTLAPPRPGFRVGDFLLNLVSSDDNILRYLSAIMLLTAILLNNLVRIVALS